MVNGLPLSSGTLGRSTNENSCFHLSKYSKRIIQANKLSNKMFCLHKYMFRMTWKTKFDFRILGLSRVPPQNTGTWESGAGGVTMCAMRALWQLADLAQTCFNLINILCFLFSLRPVWPKALEGSITQWLRGSFKSSGCQKWAYYFISLRLNFSICQMGLMIPVW